MKWFGRKAAGRETARPALARAFSGVTLGEWPRSYEAQAREAYLGNPVAQRAVKLVAESVGGAPLAGSDDALVALIAARSGGQALIETLAAHLLLHGNGFVQMLGDGNGRPGELFALRPERLSIEADARGWPSAYRYRVGERVARIEADPLIVSLEGADQVPAFRDTAYAVFEGLQLADFGNRIPSLTFEVEADAAPVSIGDIAASLSGGDIGGETARSLGGYAASGDSVRGAIETLARAAPLVLGDDGETLILVEDGDAVAIGATELGASPPGETHPRRAQQRGAGRAAPIEVSIAYYEPARDFQAGLQRARRPGAGRIAERIELPAAIGASEAKAIAEANLARGLIERVERTARLPWRRLGLTPGSRITLADATGKWRVARWSLERMALSLSLVRDVGFGVTDGAAEPGRPVTPPDLPHGATVVHLLDLPELGGTPASAPRLLVAAAGPSPGWRRAALSLSLDGGASWLDIGSTAAPAIIGAANSPLPSGSPHLFDDTGSVEIALLHDAMVLADAGDDLLLAGANMAVLGQELIQFGRAEPLGDGTWRLSRLLRGRLGTEFAIPAHEAGERFVLLEAASLRSIDAPLDAIGVDATILASGIGDSAGVEDVAQDIGVALRPPAPVNFAATSDGSGGFALSWTRRSRAGWRWLDAVDAPLVEESETYRIVVSREGAPVRIIEVVAPVAAYPVAMLAADADGADALGLELTQLGTFAASRPVTLTLELD